MHFFFDKIFTGINYLDNIFLSVLFIYQNISDFYENVNSRDSVMLECSKIQIHHGL